MEQKLGNVTFLVRDYDEAIKFFTEKLRFRLIEDTKMSQEKRWVVVAPQDSDGCGLLLAKATTKAQTDNIGNQTGGRVAFFLNTNDFYRDYEYMKNAGVEFTEEPRKEKYGTVIVFKDLYGNKWDFIGPAEKV